MSGLPRPYRNGKRSWESVQKEFGAKKCACVERLNEGRGLYMYGDAGSGKTSIAAAYLADQLIAGKEGYYVYAPDLFTELAAIYSSNNQTSRRDVIERYAETQCLLLDDIDKAKVSTHSAEILGAIFDFRYREQRTWTVLTANCSLDELAGRFATMVGDSYAEPLLRRIAETTISVPMRRAE